MYSLVVTDLVIEPFIDGWASQGEMELMHLRLSRDQAEEERWVILKQMKLNAGYSVVIHANTDLILGCGPGKSYPI